jgi:hypothetical protein
VRAPREFGLIAALGFVLLAVESCFFGIAFFLGATFFLGGTFFLGTDFFCTLMPSMAA